MRTDCADLSFREFVKNEKAENYINNLSPQKIAKIRAMEKASINNKVNVYIDTFVKDGKEKLRAEVGHKLFKEGLFYGPVSLLHRATNFANKLNIEQCAQRALTEGMSIPRIG